MKTKEWLKKNWWILVILISAILIIADYLTLSAMGTDLPFRGYSFTDKYTFTYTNIFQEQAIDPEHVYKTFTFDTEWWRDATRHTLQSIPFEFPRLYCTEKGLPMEFYQDTAGALYGDGFFYICTYTSCPGDVCVDNMPQEAKNKLVADGWTLRTLSLGERPGCYDGRQMYTYAQLYYGGFSVEKLMNLFPDAICRVSLRNGNMVKGKVIIFANMLSCSTDGVKWGEMGYRVIFYLKPPMKQCPDGSYVLFDEICPECKIGETKCIGSSYYTCENQKWVNKGEVVGKCGVAPPTPPKPVPLWRSIITSIIDWIISIFKFFGLAITGQTEVSAGSTQTYHIELTANIPDSNYSDGTYQLQYGSWSLIDKSGNVIKEGPFEKIDGNYTKDVTIIVPSNAGNYAIVGIIYQYDMAYSAEQWGITSEGIIAKESLNVATKIPSPPAPSPPLWSNIINLLKSIWDWIKGWFGI